MGLVSCARMEIASYLGAYFGATILNMSHEGECTCPKLTRYVKLNIQFLAHISSVEGKGILTKVTDPVFPGSSDPGKIHPDPQPCFKHPDPQPCFNH